MRPGFILVVFLFNGWAVAAANEPWQPPDGPGCFEQWISEFSRIVNRYDGSDEFNSRKPWRINQYGLFVGKKIQSNYEPDDWVRYGANRYQWMWGHYDSELQWPDWKNSNFNQAGLPGLRYFVRACIKQAGGTVGTVDAGSSGTPSTQVCPPIPQGSGDADCPGNFSALAGTQIIIGCNCPASSIQGKVWGTSIYTTDSSICAAARHAGAIGGQGGPVWVQGAPGRPNYQGTTQNSITTSNYGNYKASFRFPVAGAKPAQTTNTNACPTDAISQRGQIGESQACHCAPDSMVGKVWGSGVYTDDSSICAAALHAGVVSAGGGSVSYIILPGQESYQGSTRNGVSTISYGNWKGSFRSK